MSNVVVRLEKLGKQYYIHRAQRERYVALRDVVASRFATALRFSGTTGHATTSRTEAFWALKDVTFDVDHGERVGLIGRNGAGKSTLLKIVSRITPPTVGRVSIRGRVASLLEVGTGFHPELTGRENVFLNGAILGMNRREIARKFDEIVSFAEVERFLETPVKRYSSGMYVRLAFAVAAHLEPEILLVDEVLAVGDVRFQRKCLGKMEDVSRQGRTVIFVSHNMGAVVELCSRGILLEGGEVAMIGEMKNVAMAYASSPRADATVELADDAAAACSITRLRMLRADGTSTTEFDLSDSVRLEMIYRVMEPLYQLQMTATLYRHAVPIVHSFDTDHMDEILWTSAGVYRATYTLPPMFLKAGTYSVRVTAGTPDRLIQDVEQAIVFTVDELTVNTRLRSYRAERPGYVISPGRWTTEYLENYTALGGASTSHDTGTPHKS